MADVIVLDDCIEIITKVWIENYRGTPHWSSHYRGPAFQTGMNPLSQTQVNDHESTCGGFAWVRTRNESDGPGREFLTYLAQFDVSCHMQADPDLQVYGHSEYVANLVFRVKGEDGSARFDGNVYQRGGISSRMCFMDWSDNKTLLTEIGETVPLEDGHIYRLTIHTTMSGYHDPTEIVYNILLGNACLSFSDQPVVCCSADACPERSRIPSPPKLERG